MDIYIKEPQQPAKACIIWMHGLGADAENMMAIAEQLNLKSSVRHVFLEAPVRPVTLNNFIPMRAWYDIIGLKLSDREDRIGITQSMQSIEKVIQEQCATGLKSNQIYLAGFSQGGAMALYAGLHIMPNIAGVVSLSAYLPLVRELDTPKHVNLPIFMAIGEHDQVVWPDWTKYAYDWLVEQNFTNVALHEYPMEHTVCIAELRDLSNWLNAKMEESL
jgi:phospholipase/carboxylesterase